MTRREFVVAALALFAIRRRPGVLSSAARAPRAPIGATRASPAALEGRARQFMSGIVESSHQQGRPLGEVLAERRTTDFASGNTVIIDGWIVAESESLVCAALALPAAIRR